MPKLFFRKKNKKQVEEKPHIKDSLAPRPAFAAVPLTPPPQRTAPQSHTTPRPASAPATPSETPQAGYFLLEQPDQLSNEESDGSEPGYSTVKRGPRFQENHTRPGDEQDTLSSRPRMASPQSTDVVQPSPPHQRSSASPTKHDTSASPLQERVPSTSELPSVTSLDGHSSDQFSSPPLPGREAQRSQRMTEEEKAQLYSTVSKIKKDSKTAELPPRSPHSRARGSESPSTRKEKVKHSRTKQTSPLKHNTLTTEDGFSRQRTASKYHSRKESREEPLQESHSPHSRRLEHRKKAKEQEEDHAPVLDFSDEDYLPSDEASESCTEGVSPEVPQRHRHQSAGHPTHRPPINSPGKRARSSGRHSGRHQSSSPHASLSQPPHLQSFSHDSQPVYLLSKRQPDGSLQYYTATAVSSPLQTAPPESGYFSTLPQQPVLNWQDPLHMSAQIPHPGQMMSAVNQGQLQNIPPLQSYTLQDQQTQETQSGGKHSNTSSPPWPLSSGQTPPSATSELQPSLLSAPNTSTAARNLGLQLAKLSPSDHAPLEHQHATTSKSPPTKASTTRRGSPRNIRRHLDMVDGLGDDGKEMDQKAALRASVGSAHPSSGRQATDIGVSQEQMKVYQEMLAAAEQRELSLKVQVTTLEGASVTLQAENAALKQLCDSSRDEKNKLMKVHKDEVGQLKEEIAKLSLENQILLSRIQEGEVEQEGWGEVAAHARLVLEENSTLLRQQELQREQAKEMRREHQAIVSQLSGEVAQLRKERESLEKDLRCLGESHSQLQEHFQVLSNRSSKQLTVEEYQHALQEVEGLVEELADRTEANSKKQEAHLRVTQKEKNGLVTKLTDAKAVILQLEEECTALHKTGRRAQERIAELQYELEVSRDREVVAHDQLSRLTVQVKKARAERDTFARIAKSQQSDQDRTNTHRVRDDYAISKLKKKVEMYKQQASQDRGKASLLLRESEHHLRSQQRRYREEIQQLRSQLGEKQSNLDKLARDKKSVENQLDLVWKASTAAHRTRPHVH